MLRRLLLVTLPTLVAAMLAGALATEAWVRATWDSTRGTPGFFVSDPVRLEKLAPDYTGWFAGVPVRINHLGFRDTREYALAKGPKTFRILVLGDSVTFGHGSVFEHTWPYLFEQRLKVWRPDVAWQVWNLGVPGYNTSQELAYLLEAGPRFTPDLVVVGFFANDIVDNQTLRTPTRAAIWASDVKTIFRRHMYSLEMYKKQYLMARQRMLSSDAERALLAGIATQEQMLARPGAIADASDQKLTDPPPLSDDEITRDACPNPPHHFAPEAITGIPAFPLWKQTVEQVQRLGHEGPYRVVFFINSAPADCIGHDIFDPRATGPEDGFLLSILGQATPAVSSHDAFIRFRPSTMPRANGHSLGNANAVKADVLFRFLSAGVLAKAGVQ